MPAPPEYDRVHPRYKRRLGDIGMWLFLGALGVLFGAGLMGYVLIRTRVFGEGSIGSVRIQLPEGFWFSTAIIIAASFAIHQAVEAVSHERQKAFRQWLWATLILGALFVIVQIPSLIMLLERHMEMLREVVRQGQRHNALYGFIFFLIALHALHVIGGIIVLIRMGIHGLKGEYDHEHYDSVRHAAQYWHFLDIVWIILFLTIWLIA
jgi:heme/copper-type cytochrome/quinol oxidase subunit 3